jgi:hypothetical protein
MLEFTIVDPRLYARAITLTAAFATPFRPGPFFDAGVGESGLP